MATPEKYAKLAQTLPPRLLRFFARYPPPSGSGLSSNTWTEPANTPLSTSSAYSSTYHNDPSTDDAHIHFEAANPFRSQKHPVTGKWHDPVYSLRRQADLVKLARAHGVEELLPFTVKGTQERIRKREEQGLRVKGTGVGQRVKGKEWERTMKGRLDRRKQAMLEMPSMIQKWKQVRLFLMSLSLELNLRNCRWDTAVDGRNGLSENLQIAAYGWFMDDSKVVYTAFSGHSGPGVHSLFYIGMQIVEEGRVNLEVRYNRASTRTAVSSLHLQRSHSMLYGRRATYLSLCLKTLVVHKEWSTSSMGGCTDFLWHFIYW